MPGFDGTGPLGQGPMTGGGRGYCVVPLNKHCRGWCDPRFFGRGRGRGYRHWFWATGLPGWIRAAYGYPAFGGWVNPYAYPYYVGDASQLKEIDILKEQAEVLKQQLQDIQDRIKEIEESEKEDDK
ncbi:hypothetical protein JOD02_001576 [Caldicoprobacter guelmensis]|uniref:DUF5320 domain-containing protein n=1 Tax=Caldicoprobacter guelmensis TaxID=1170224 RepID=UPI00195EFD40|nr:DUF5320 domain-containing protein [Caldicoprobacter guelmensis]MBM7582719.1 hypothetical protein [Caldicoprobacter guelmensis]